MFDSSEESGEVTSGGDSSDPYRPHHPSHLPITQKIEKLSTTLKDTSRNLKSIDKLVGTYREVGLRQTVALEKLQEGLARGGFQQSKLTELYQSQGSLAIGTTVGRQSTSPSRLFHVSSDDYIILPRDSHYQPRDGHHRSDGGNIRYPAARFSSAHSQSQGLLLGDPPITTTTRKEEPNSFDSVHELHQNVRDIANEQKEIKLEMNRLAERRHSVGRNEISAASISLGQQASSAKVTLTSRTKPEQLRTIASQVDRRLMESNETLRVNRLDQEEKRYLERLRGEVAVSPRLATGGVTGPMSAAAFPTEPPFLSSGLKSALEQLHENDDHRPHTSGGVGNKRIVPGASKPSSLDEQPISADILMRSKLKQSDMALKSVQTEVGELKRKLVQEEALRLTVCRQLDELQERYSALEKEKSRLKSLVESGESKIRRMTSTLEENESFLRSHNQMEQELRELKQKLLCTVPMSDLDDARRQREKGERHVEQVKEQLSQALMDGNEKDKQIHRLLQEMRQLQDDNESTERTREDLKSRLLAAEQSLREVRSNERLALERAQRAEKLHEDVLLTRDSQMQSNSQSLVNLRNKFESQENEKSQLREALLSQTKLTEVASHERDEVKEKYALLLGQCESLRTELESILSVRAKQEEMLRRRSEELETQERKIEELNSRANILDKAAQMAKYSHEGCEKELSLVREERARLEERLSASENNDLDNKEKCRMLKMELDHCQAEKEEWQIKHQQGQLTMKDLRFEIDSLRASLKQVKKELVTVCRDSAEHQQRTLTQEQRWTEEGTALRQELLKSQACLKMLKSRCERQITEISRLHDEHWRMDQDNIRLTHKYSKLRQMLQKKEVESESELLKSRHQVELECTELQEKLDDVVQHRDKVLRWTTQDVDGLVELVAKCVFQWKTDEHRMPPDLDLSQATVQLAFSDVPSSVDVNRWLIDLKSKLSWLRTEIQRLATLSRKEAASASSFSAHEVPTNIPANGNAARTMTCQDDIKPTTAEDLEKRYEKLQQSLKAMDSDVVEATVDFLSSTSTQQLEELAALENQRILHRYDYLKETLHSLRRDLQSVQPQQTPKKTVHYA